MLRSFLSDVDLTLDPYPVVVGVGEVEPNGAAPAWECLGYGAVAGTADENPYGVAVLGTGEASYDAHLLALDPVTDTLYEAMRRRVDGAWLARTYTPVGRGDLDRAGRIGPSALTNAARSPLRERGVEQLPRLLRAIERKLGALASGANR